MCNYNDPCVKTGSKILKKPVVLFDLRPSDASGAPSTKKQRLLVRGRIAPVVGVPTCTYTVNVNAVTSMVFVYMWEVALQGEFPPLLPPLPPPLPSPFCPLFLHLSFPSSSDVS